MLPTTTYSLSYSQVQINFEYIEIGTAEALDQRDRTCVSCLLGVTGFMYQVRCNGAVNDTQHMAHDEPDGWRTNPALKSPLADLPGNLDLAHH
jgi:hypothetical protein